MGFFLLELQGHQIVKPICFHLLAVTDLQEVNQSCFRSQEPQQHQAASKCSVHPQALQYFKLVNLVVLYYSVILNHQSFIHVCLHPQTLLQYHVTNKEFFHLLALQSHWLVLKIYFYYQTRQHQQKINSKPVCFSHQTHPNLFSFLKATSSIKEKLSSFSLSSTKASSCSKCSCFPRYSSAGSSGDQSGLFSFSNIPSQFLPSSSSADSVNQPILFSKSVTTGNKVKCTATLSSNQPKM